MLFWILLTTACKTDPSPRFVLVKGETMGTFYSVKSETELDPRILKKDVDSLLVALNQNLSTYIPDSHISRVNTSSKESIGELPEQFWVNLKSCLKWHDLSGGYFDPSVMPLVNYWGFGYTPKLAVLEADSMSVDSIMNFVGLLKWTIDFDKEQVEKIDKRQQLDFSALAKGYGVDVIADFLESRGIRNYLIDIGGEGRAKGLNDKGNLWVVGINMPDTEARYRDVSGVVVLDNISLATSGNYRNYHKVNGSKYGHTISPITGYPFQDRLLSVSVVAEKCMDADAIATACMAMGLDKARTFIANLESVEACFLAGSEDGTIETIYSNGFIRHTYQQGAK